MFQKETMNFIPALLKVLSVALSLSLIQSTQAQEKKITLPKGYEEVGPDKVEVLRRLCQATAETKLFTGAVLVTDQPYRMPAKTRLTQEQRMYQLVKSAGVEAAIEWFKTNWKKAAWGGSNFALATQLIKDDRIDDGIRLMEFDIETTSGKVWMLRKASEASLNNGRPQKALSFLQMALERRPDDEEFKMMKIEVEQDLKRESLKKPLVP